jgi:hypothetical protein
MRQADDRLRHSMRTPTAIAPITNPIRSANKKKEGQPPRGTDEYPRGLPVGYAGWGSNLECTLRHTDPMAALAALRERWG